jgi:regulation of enolase protein 1 (concanavalin A-like superfamily)
VEVPTSTAKGLYAVFVKNTDTGAFSAYRFVNRARPLGMLDTAQPTVRPGQNIRIHGRNLDDTATTTTVKFRQADPAAASFGQTFNAAVTQGSDPYIIQVTTPSIPVEGRYQIIANNGYGSTNGDSVNTLETFVAAATGTDYWGLGVTWANQFPFSTKVFNVKTGFGAAGDGTTYDGTAIQNAINAANAYVDPITSVQGGVVYFPAGTYNVSNAALAMKSRVILQGAGMNATKLSDNSGLRATLFTGNVSNIGVVDLTIECGLSGAYTPWDVGGSGALRHFLLRSRFVSNRGKVVNRGATYALIDGCEIIHRAIGSDVPLDYSARLHFIIRNSRIEWVHGRVPFLDTGNVQIENNIWSRSVQRIVSGVQYGGPSFSNADNVVVLNNTFNRNPYLLDGSPTPAGTKIPESNDGETLLNEHVPYDGSGPITGATDTTLEDTSTSKWNTVNSKVGFQVTITEGKGIGQSRTITANQPYQLTVSPAWDIVPDAASSKYAVSKPDFNYLVKGNLLQEVPRGIWLCYANTMTDVAIVGNSLIDAQGIYLRGDARDDVRQNVLTNVIVEGNTLQSNVRPGTSAPWYPSQIVADQVFVSGTAGLNPGNPFYNVVVRNNSITIPVTGGVSNVDVGSGEGDGYFARLAGSMGDDDTTAVFGLIFDRNTATNFTSVSPFNLNGGAVQTTIFNSVSNNVFQLLNDTKAPNGGTHLSLDTVVAWSPNSNVTPPFVWISAPVASPVEGSLTTGKFRFSRSTTAGSLAVNYTINGASTASASDYYQTLTGTVTIPSGAQFVDVTITPVHDGLVEGKETLILKLSPSVNYTIGNPSETMTFIDKDMTMVSDVVGAPSNAGSFDVNAGVFSLSGTGTTFSSGTADNFRFAYNTLTGDGSITARVASTSGSMSVWDQMGVMIRESLAPGARQVGAMARSGQAVQYVRRTATDGASSATAGATVPLPHWVRVTRAGNVLTAFRSADGATWVQIGTATLSSPALASTVYIGLAKNSTGLMTVNYDNVSTTGNIGTAPESWVAGDVGSVGVAGNASYDEATGTFTVNGSGTDIFGSADAFHFVRRTAKLSGDGSITARLVSGQNTHSTAKYGVMLRETTAANARYAMMAITPTNGGRFQYRSTVGGTTSTVSPAGLTAPRWIRLTRVGNNFTAAHSLDGVSWTTVTTQAVAMATDLEVGLAACSHNNSVLGQAVFDSVTITP